MVCVPEARLLRLRVALPEVLSVCVPSEVEPSKKVTEPLGVPAPGAFAVMVAVKVTLWPKADGFSEDVTADVVESLLTTCDSGADVLPVKLGSLVYVAVIE